MTEPRRHMTPEQMQAVDAALDKIDAQAEQAAKRRANGRIPSPPSNPAGVRPDHALQALIVERWSTFRDNHNADHVEYVVDGVAQKGGVGFIAGGPKNGKTWNALHMGVAIATGKQYTSRYSTQREPVVYLALEGTRANIRARVGCLARGLGVDPDSDELDQLHVIYKPRRIDLHDPRAPPRSCRPSPASNPESCSSTFSAAPPASANPAKASQTSPRRSTTSNH